MEQHYSKDRRPGAKPDFRDVLRGKIAFIAMIKPGEDELVKKFQKQFTNLSEGRPMRDAEELVRSNETAPIIKILHLSDFHFREGTRWDSDPMLQSLTDELAVHGSRPDLVCVTGDIAFSGKAEEYKLADGWFKNLANRLGLAPQDFLFVAGNHDVDQGITSFGVNAIVEELQTEKHELGALIAQIQSNPTDLKLLEIRFSAYLSFVRSFRGDGNLAKTSWALDQPFEGSTLRILGLCSAISSNRNDDHGRLVLGEPIVNGLAKGDADLKIGLVHHPRDYIRDADEVSKKRLETWADLILQGHRHGNSVSQIAESGGSVTTISAGSAYQGSHFPNSVNIIEIDLSDRRFSVEVLLWLTKELEWITSKNEKFAESDEDGRGLFKF